MKIANVENVIITEAKKINQNRFRKFRLLNTEILHFILDIVKRLILQVSVKDMEKHILIYI